MENFSRQRAGSVTTTKVQGNVTTITSAASVASDESLTNSGIVHGDFVNPNAWSWNYSNRRRAYGTVRDKSSTFTTIKDGDDLGITSRDPLSMTSIGFPYNEALSRIYDDIRGSVDLAVDLAEMHQTTKMITGFTGDFKKFFRSFRGGPKAFIKALANAELQYVYGISPMISTAYELAERQLRFAASPLTIVKRASVTDNGLYVERTFPRARHLWKVSRRTEVSLSYSTGGQSLALISQYMSLNPLSIMWELTTASFLVDWFIDIGGYLRNAETSLMSGLQFHSGYRTDSYLAETYTETVDSQTQFGTTSTFNTKSSFVKKGCRRSKLTSLPRPELPRLEVDLGSRRLLSLAALLAQFLK